MDIKNNYLAIVTCAIVSLALNGCGAEQENKQMTEASGGMVFVEGNFADVLAMAQERDLPIFVDVYTEWCGPCKVMVADVFSRDDVGEYYNANYINWKIDAEDPDSDGPAFAEKYGAFGFPSYLYMDKNGELMRRRNGLMDPAVFIAVGKSVLGEDPAIEFQMVADRYEAGDRDADLVRSYILEGAKVMANFELPAIPEEQALGGKIVAALHEYVNSHPPSQLVTEDDFQILKSNLGATLKLSRGHEYIEYMIDHYDEYVAVLPNEEEFGIFLMNANYTGINDAGAAGNRELFEEYVKDIDTKLAKAYAFNDADIVDPVKVLTSLGEQEHAMSQGEFAGYLKHGWDFVMEGKELLGASQFLIYYRRLRMTEGGEEFYPETEKFIKYAYENFYNSYVATDYGHFMATMGEKEKAREFYAQALAEFKEMGGDRGQFMIDRFTQEMKELGL